MSKVIEKPKLGRAREIPHLREYEVEADVARPRLKEREITQIVIEREPIEEIGMGWLPDLPDFRDYTMETNAVNTRLQNLKQVPIKAMLKKAALEQPISTLPPVMDLRPWCPPIENQLNLGSCTANAAVGVVEYFENRAFGRYLDASRLFVYKVTRDLLHWHGDTGAYLRTTMGSLVLFGVPPEEYWPYMVAQCDVEPSAFCYAFAQNYQAIQYYRLDPIGTSMPVLLDRIKMHLAAGIPSMFGFTVFNSISQANTTGKIPFPTSGETVLGGHAIVAVGYDDGIKIKNANAGGVETTGAFLIRNSWSPTWGDKGYGWLPYEYILRGVARDWWVLLKNGWVDMMPFRA